MESKNKAADARHAISELEALVESLRNLDDLNSIDARSKLIGIRRKLPNAFQSFEHEVSSATAIVDGGHLHEFQKLFAGVRHDIAMHQSAWSAAIISSNPSGYKASFEACYTAFRLMIEWSYKHLETS